MKRTGILARLGGALVLSAACAMPMTGFGEDNGNNDSNRSERQAQQSQDKQKQDLKLKVFELEHRTPQEMAQLLRLQSGQGQAPGQAFGQPGAAQPAPATRTAGYRGADQPARVVAIKDEDTDFLFVRGPEEKVDEVEKLIESFDNPADEIEKQEVGDVHLIPVRNDKGQQVQTVLGQLGLQSQLVRLGETALIAIRADEEDQLKQAEQVIEKLAGEKDEKSDDQDSENDRE